MIEFVTKLKRKVENDIRLIESSEENVPRRYLAISETLEKALGGLKAFVLGYVFTDEHEEIRFFKEIKPSIFSRLIFYRKVYYIEIDRPMGTFDVQVEYLERELARITEYIRKRLGFYRYYRSGATYLDHFYFMRGRHNPVEHYRDSFLFERDPGFSTVHDFTVAKILSYDMLQMYLREELGRIGHNRFLPDSTPAMSADGPRWTDKKSGLIEILYALDTLGSFDGGRISLKKLQDFFELHCDVSLGNISRAFNDMMIRKNPTPYLDMMKQGLIERMESKGKKYSGDYTRQRLQHK